MITCHKQGVFVKNGLEILSESPHASQSACAKQTMAYQIMDKHNHSQESDSGHLRLKFDALASHDITYVGVIQTVRAAEKDFEKFPVPYVLTNCHNSLCAVGGTTNEDDHVFGLSAAKKYGGIFVPPHIAVIHQYMREAMAGCGKMILGSDSHTRYGVLGTMGFGEGGGELVKQILGRTYDIPAPEVVAVHLAGTPRPGVGPQDVALALIGAVFAEGTVKNKVLEFIGPGVANLSVEYRMGIDVMTTETACLSSIWVTDDKVEEYYAVHGRQGEYTPMKPGDIAYYDGLITIDLSQIVPMIAMPFHPSNVYTIAEVQKNAPDILRGIENQIDKDAPSLKLQDLCLPGGGLKVDQGIIAGCAGGLYESICEAAEIMDKYGKGDALLDAFSLSVYPASQPMFLAMVENGVAAKLMQAGVIMKTAFCGPCFGAGDVPRHNGLSIRHTTRNFPNREGAKPSLGQSAAVALMDALSIAATAANGGVLTGADALLDSRAKIPTYYFNNDIYQKRIYDGFGNSKNNETLAYAPGIRDWPELLPMADDILLAVASYITDPVTTTDELIPSGETSAFRSNPYALAEHTLSRKDPGYVERAKKIAHWEAGRKAGESLNQIPELKDALAILEAQGQISINPGKTAVGSVVYAKKPGDGSAREQAASCQRVLGGIANIAQEYATKRYRSNLINWGMLPFLLPGDADFGCGDFIFVPGVRAAISSRAKAIPAYVVDVEQQAVRPVTLEIAALTDDEVEILLAGCLINYYREG
ncbi:MAG: hydratase [Defluviitaleaceae bacterium]|nr:hydratase [Defluviitaleaceae bacterium]